MNTIQAFCKMNNLEGEPNLWLVVAAGITIVFLGMIILTVVLYIMSAIGKKKPAKEEKNETSAETTAPAVEEAPTSMDDGELYAVIAAAIAAYEAEHGRAPSIKAAQVKRVCKKYNQDRKNG